jgi:membrane-associated phospholipid phosphatase
LRNLKTAWLRALAVPLSIFLGCSVAVSQTGSSDEPVASASPGFGQPSSIEILPALPENGPPSSVGQGEDGQRPGFIMRNVRRGLEDQKELYSAPFKVKNIKWDAMTLVGTAAFLATDRQVMRNIPRDHVDISHNLALLALGATSVAAGGIWAWGIKTDNAHAKETGALELEALANTFLIYTPMQFAAGRERPDEGTGNGRFWRHGNFNTSFPAGHPMFTWAMSTMIAHEYPKTWVKILAYGAAVSVSGARLTGRNHFPSDIWVGSLLGYFISSHIFHAHCEPGLSEACRRE